MAIDFESSVFREIDVEAARKKAAASYLTSLIRGKKFDFMEAFTAQGLPDDATTSFLYERVTGMIEGLTAEKVAPSGVRLRYLLPGDIGTDLPAVALGWASYQPLALQEEDRPVDRPFPHKLLLTDEGTAIIDAYRAELGLPTLEAQAGANRKSWE